MKLSVKLLKRLIWLSALPVGLLLLFQGLQTLAALYGYFERAQVVDSALNLIEPRRAKANYLSWLSDPPNLPRPMESFTRDAITNDYLLAFEELSYGHFTGDNTGLKSYFQEGALDDALLVTTHTTSEWIDWAHKLQLTFYAPDGATIAFTDTFKYAQGLIAEGDLLDIRIAERTMDVILQLDDGNWRIHHWRVLKDRIMSYPDQEFPELAKQIADIRGVNYIARSAPLNTFWSSLSEAEIEGDFATIQSLGFNTLRFFIPYPAPEELNENLLTLLDIAERYQLQVIPTLLDGYSHFGLEDLPQVLAHITSIENALQHPSIILIDIKDLTSQDIPLTDSHRIRSFLSYLLNFTRSITGNPVTIGLADHDALLSKEVDVLTLHHYGSPDILTERLKAAKNKPLLLEAFGFHTASRQLLNPQTEVEQAWYFQRILETTERLQSGWLAWTLYDLPKGALATRPNLERPFGLLKSDGRAKQVIKVLQGSSIATPTIVDTLLKYRYLLIVIFISMCIILWRVKSHYFKPKTENL
jgi:hypothetical protein